MAREFIKGLTMVLLVVAVASITSTAYGQASRATRANIPFDFVVGNTNLPAGEYEVASISGTGETLRITNTDSQKSVYRMTSSLGTPIGTTAKLVFHRYGSQYFLSEVWGAGQPSARKVMRSKSEKAAESETAAVRAKGGNAPTYERIEIVALNR